MTLLLTPLIITESMDGTFERSIEGKLNRSSPSELHVPLPLFLLNELGQMFCAKLVMLIRTSAVEIVRVFILFNFWGTTYHCS